TTKGFSPIARAIISHQGEISDATSGVKQRELEMAATAAHPPNRSQAGLLMIVTGLPGGWCSVKGPLFEKRPETFYNYAPSFFLPGRCSGMLTNITTAAMAALIVAVMLLGGLGGVGQNHPAGALPQLTDITQSTGIKFSHASSADKKYIVESMSGGVALIDYDRDAWPDIYFTNAPTVEMAR